MSGVAFPTRVMESFRGRNARTRRISGRKQKSAVKLLAAALVQLLIRPFFPQRFSFHLH